MNPFVLQNIIPNAQSPGLTPYTGPELFGWWDPSDALNVTKVSGRFEVVNDLSGNGRDLNSSGSSRPFDGRYTNGLEGMDFRGAESIYTSPYSTQTTPNVYIFVSKIDVITPGSYEAIFSAERIGGGTNDVLYYGDVSGNWFLYSGTTLIGGAVNLNVNIITAIFGSSAKLYQNGVLISSGNSGVGNSIKLAFGSRYNALSEFMDGVIWEPFFYNSLITNTQLNQTGQYLADKYGVSYTDIT